MKNKTDWETANAYDNHITETKKVEYNKANLNRIFLKKTLRNCAKVYKCTNKHPKAQLIFKVLACAINKINADAGAFPKTYPDSVSYVYASFLPWLSTHKLLDGRTICIIKDFETFLVNERKIKPQSTKAKYLVQALEIGLPLIKRIQPSERAYINAIIEQTSLSLPEPAIQKTLTSWIEEMPWIRNYIDAKIYNQIASPKLLMDSFSITIASSLNYIQSLISSLEEFCITQNIKSTDIKVDQSYNRSEYKQRKKLLKILELFCHQHRDTICPKLRAAILLDLSNPSRLNNNKERLDLDEKFHYYNGDGSCMVYLLPALFTTDLIEQIIDRAECISIGSHPKPRKHTLIEQQLFMWLMAWLTVQPQDISKLTLGDWRYLPNRNKPKNFYLTYYKNRSFMFRETRMLSSKTIEGRAILNYLALFDNEKDSSNSRSLFSESHKVRTPHMGNRSPTQRALRLISNPPFSEAISRNIAKRKSSGVFLNIISTILKHIEKSGNQWVKEAKKNGRVVSLEHYRSEYKYPIPALWFSNQALKNSSVHSQTDLLREGHLICTNSHSSSTEIKSYLSPQNLEWLNNKGRLTRMVMNEIADKEYNLNYDSFFNEIDIRVNEKRIRTQIKRQKSETTRLTEIDFNEIDLLDKIIVLETKETVAQFIDYLDQSKKNYVALLENAPLFLERTVIPNCEWIEELLAQQFDKKVVKTGKQLYLELKDHFAPKFIPQLRG